MIRFQHFSLSAFQLFRVSVLRPPSSVFCPPSSVFRPPSPVLRPPSSTGLRCSQIPESYPHRDAIISGQAPGTRERVNTIHHCASLLPSLKIFKFHAHLQSPISNLQSSVLCHPSSVIRFQHFSLSACQLFRVSALRPPSSVLRPPSSTGLRCSQIPESYPHRDAIISGEAPGTRERVNTIHQCTSPLPALKIFKLHTHLPSSIFHLPSSVPCPPHSVFRFQLVSFSAFQSVRPPPSVLSPPPLPSSIFHLQPPISSLLSPPPPPPA